MSNDLKFTQMVITGNILMEGKYSGEYNGCPVDVACICKMYAVLSFFDI